MNTKESPLQAERRQLAEGAARRREAAKRDPVAKAAAMTEAERKRVGEAQVAAEQAEAEVGRIGFRMRQLETVIEDNRVHEFMGSTGGLFGSRRQSGDPKAVAQARAELQDMPLRLQAARDNAQAALRRLRHVEGQVSAARRQRRREAEAKIAPKPSKPTMPTVDGWQAALVRRYGNGS